MTKLKAIETLLRWNDAKVADVYDDVEEVGDAIQTLGKEYPDVSWQTCREVAEGEG